MKATEHDSPAYKKGVTCKGKGITITEDIDSVIGINQCALKSPLFVNSEVAAKKISSITVYFRDKDTKKLYGSFTLSKLADPKKATNLPTINHAFWLDILLGLFSSNWNSRGILLFNVPHVLSIAGFKNDSKARQCLFETILRYSRTSCIWDHSFGKNYQEYSGPLIVKQDIWKEDVSSKLSELNEDEESVVFEKINSKKGRVKKESFTHMICFHQKIVDSLDPHKDPETRLFLSDTFRLKLSRSAYSVYRFLYGHCDNGEIWKSLYDPKDGLIHVFSWMSHKSKFKAWLDKQLEALQSYNLIEYYKYREDNSAVCIKISNRVCHEKTASITTYENPQDLIINDQNIITDIHYENAKSLGIRQRKGASRKPKNIPIDKMTDEQVLALYETRKQLGFVKPEHSNPIDVVISINKKMAIDLIRTHVLPPDRLPNDLS